MDNFEELISDLKEKRTKLQQSDSFDEMTQIWKNLKEINAKCEVFLKDVSKEIENLENKEEKDFSDLGEIKFAEALNEINQISQNIEMAPICKIPEMLKRMQKLKSFCAHRLEEQRVNMEEMK